MKQSSLPAYVRQAVVSLFLLFGSLMMANLAMANTAMIELDKVLIGNMVSITPVVSNLPEGAYGYRMKLVKSGRSGNTSSAQSGRFTVSGDSPERLSTTSVNLDPADSCELTVALTLNGREFMDKRFKCLP